MILSSIQPDEVILRHPRTFKALTIRQPWASLIIEAGKDIENRSRRTHVRGWVLVHAGLSWSEQIPAFDFCRAKGLIEYQQTNADGSTSEPVRAVLQSDPYLGCIIGAMHLSDASQIMAKKEVPLYKQKPVLPCQGSLGWFNVELPPEMEALIPKS